ncbi:hypothetical protein RH858_04830 [Halalkaliarchaeum sp. AArc-GB]|uniref:hypothetical protein n=1 Tax=Halalkaliarchaeum sp. AArc-GB TaxID=3074078 RepID=UPI00285F7A62|nr:hypothetical protein [Halalkaliarchaeum sp. AArc-GB]MDR5672474.1 hypothetical protein [Halalkaliarchaeum sp. AArc-GB]
MTDHGTPAGDERSESLTDWFRGVRSWLSRTADRSAVVGIGRRASSAGERVADVVEGSWLYRWLTAEPEPEVVVIDLRETYTVGPFIRLLDLLLERGAEWADSSRFVSGLKTGIDRITAAPLRVGGAFVAVLAAVGLIVTLLTGEPSTAAGVGLVGLLLVGALATRDERSWSELQETRPVRLLAAAFEPPEPPESEPSESEPEESAGSREPTHLSKRTETADAGDDREQAG